MIICISGPSCVGKTTIARRLAEVGLQVPMRSCGDAIRQAATAIGSSIGALSDDVHRSVDAATVEWAIEHSRGCIIEGRFLNAVFAGAGVSAFTIELRADIGRRVERANLRYGVLTYTECDLSRSDAADANIRVRLFGAHADAPPEHVLDTTNLTADECACRVQEIVVAMGLRRRS